MLGIEWAGRACWTAHGRRGTALIAAVLVAALPSCGGDVEEDDGDPTGPVPWSLGTESQTALEIGTSATSPIVELQCPDGSVGIGFEGRHGNVLDHLRLRCAVLGSTGALGNVTTTEMLGNSTGGAAFTTECASDGAVATMLVGDRGNRNGHIHNLQGQCRRPADVAAGAANSAATLTTNLLGGGPFGDSESYELFCADGAAVTGLRGQFETATGFVAAVGYICRVVIGG